ncbi:MAG: DUF4040 domain-containing protein [Clostridia bacterium]|nr:DUF4040 domain-containing protein [Clostridia bacterium]
MFILIMMVVFLILIIGVGLAALEIKDLLGAVVAYSAFSYLAVALYLILGSPDVGFTEAVIGVISSVFFIFAIKEMNRWCAK